LINEEYFLSALVDGIFLKCFLFNEDFSKTGKLRTCSKIVSLYHPAALKSEANKKDIVKAALIFFASFFGSSQKDEVGFGRIAQFYE